MAKFDFSTRVTAIRNGPKSRHSSGSFSHAPGKIGSSSMGLGGRGAGSSASLHPVLQKAVAVRKIAAVGKKK